MQQVRYRFSSGEVTGQCQKGIPAEMHISLQERFWGHEPLT